MKRRRKQAGWVVLALSVLAGLLWQFTPLPAVVALASLSDPAKLATLGKRGANPRLNKIVYWLDEAGRRGLSAQTTITWAQLLNGTAEPRAGLVKTALLENLKRAQELGLLTPENRERLRRGLAAVVTRGPYAGEPVEIDHVVPVSLAPELGNELANLEMLPQTINRRKSARVGERQLAHARKLSDAGLLSRESLARVQAAAKK